MWEAVRGALSKASPGQKAQNPIKKITKAKKKKKG
jgi:hypothetical protein